MQYIPEKELANTVADQQKCKGEKQLENITSISEARIVMEGLENIKNEDTIGGEEVIDKIKERYGI